MNEGAAVGDAHDRGFPGLNVGDSNRRFQRQGAMRGGHRVLVIDFSIGSVAVVIRAAVPACQSGFDENWLRVILRARGWFVLGGR